MRATKDANNNIHPMAISHMFATESNLSVGAHITAEKYMVDFEADDRVTIVDGGPALVGQSERLYPRNHLMRCARHLAEELAKASGGRRKRKRDEEMEECEEEDTHDEDERTLFNRIRFMSKRAARLIECELLSLPGGSKLSSIPQDQLCMAMLPKGVQTHGVTTNNFAEVVNMMLAAARREDSLLQSLLRVECLLAERQASLWERMDAVRSGGQASHQVWKEGATVPAVEAADAKARANARVLNEPRCVVRKGEEIYIVESRSGGLMKGEKGGKEKTSQNDVG